MRRRDSKWENADATPLDQQAAATLHMIDFATGQLFDWFVSGNTAFPLIERLPSSVSGSAEHVGIDKMYTQIIDEVPIAAGVPHTVAIRYTRDRQRSLVEYFLDGKRVSKVDHVGIPVDAQGVKYSGITHPSDPGSCCATRSTQWSSPTACSACSTRSRSSTRRRRR